LSTTLRHVLTEVSEFFHLNSLVCYPDLRRNGRCFGRLSASAHAYLRRTTVQHNSDRWKLQGRVHYPEQAIGLRTAGELAWRTD